MLVEPMVVPASFVFVVPGCAAHHFCSKILCRSTNVSDVHYTTRQTSRHRRKPNENQSNDDTIIPTSSTAPTTMDLGAQISQLSPDQRQALMAQAQQEANQSIMQDMMKNMVKTCFDRCAGTSVRLVWLAWLELVPGGQPEILLRRRRLAAQACDWQFAAFLNSPHRSVVFCFASFHVTRNNAHHHHHRQRRTKSIITIIIGRQVGQPRASVHGVLSRSVPGSTGDGPIGTGKATKLHVMMRTKKRTKKNTGYQHTCVVFAFISQR